MGSETMSVLVLLLLFYFPVNVNLGYHFNRLYYPMLSVRHYIYCLLTQCLNSKEASGSKRRQ